MHLLWWWFWSSNTFIPPFLKLLNLIKFVWVILNFIFLAFFLKFLQTLILIFTLLLFFLFLSFLVSVLKCFEHREFEYLSKDFTRSKKQIEFSGKLLLWFGMSFALVVYLLKIFKNKRYFQWIFRFLKVFHKYRVGYSKVAQEENYLAV